MSNPNEGNPDKDNLDKDNPYLADDQKKAGDSQVRFGTTFVVALILHSLLLAYVVFTRSSVQLMLLEFEIGPELVLAATVPLLPSLPPQQRQPSLQETGAVDDRPYRSSHYS